MKTNPFVPNEKEVRVGEALRSCGKRAHLFEEQDPSDCSEKAMTARANTITPILADILSKSDAFPHGGINE